MQFRFRDDTPIKENTTRVQLTLAFQKFQQYSNLVWVSNHRQPEKEPTFRRREQEGQVKAQCPENAYTSRYCSKQVSKILGLS